MLYYSENVTGSIGRVNLELGETGDLIMKGVGEVQGKFRILLEKTSKCNTIRYLLWDKQLQRYQ